ncbi:MAG: exopolysaccharide biosynthesis polyprenyl glycosylphosphotransferase [Anaerolineae bacterium]|nr:MAG: exopolysaccharide biosynthesis polyprenyl glycosylphosphotransferase [Anaerolineae bacterium]
MARAKTSQLRLQSGERRLILIVGDLLAASIATFGAIALWSQVDWLGFSMDFVRARAAWFILLPAIWLVLMVNLYDVRRASSMRETFRAVILAATIGGFLYLAVYFTSEPGSLPRLGMLYFLILAVLLTLIWRFIYIQVFTGRAFMRRVLLIGAGESGRTFLEELVRIEPRPFLIVGLIDDDESKHGSSVSGYDVIGGNSTLPDLIEQEDVSDIIVAITGTMKGDMFRALLDAQEQGVEITRMPAAYEEVLGRVPINYLESDWLLRSFVDEVRVSGLYLLTKRVVDIVGALVGTSVLVLLAPWVALAIVLETGRPVMYSQTRLGQGALQYRVLKFRTMVANAEPEGKAEMAVRDDPRATRIGRLLRRTYIDELPQFWNVLRGEMSLVGPRPERPELVEDYESYVPFYRARILAKPGITGWAQVNYGKGASVQGAAEKLEYDLYYIKHRGAWMDLWIILRTIGNVFGLRGI